MNAHSVKNLLKNIYKKLKPHKPKTVGIKIDPAFELKTYLEQTDISDLKKIEDYAFLQSSGPLHFFPKNNAWLVTGYDEITHVLKNHEIFSEVEVNRVMGKTDALYDLNNSEYENLRNILKNYFSNSFFKIIEEQLNKNLKIVTENILINDKVDFIKEFCHIATSETMRYIFGIDKSLIVDDSKEYRIFNFKDNLSFFEHLYTNHNNLEVDKLAFLIKNLIIKKQLSIEEASVISSIIWFGGIDSPRSLIASMMYELIKYPTIAECIKDSKVLQIKFIEECLRLYPSIKKLIRNSRTDTTINNIFIAKGSRIYLDVYTANRDRTKFEDPNQISLEKNKSRHISFGYGVAQCIGMGLARLEAKIALEYVLEILPYATLIEIKFIKHNQDPTWSELIEILSLNIKK